MTETERDERDAQWFKSGWDAALKDVADEVAAGGDHLQRFLTEQKVRIPKLPPASHLHQSKGLL